MQATYHIKASEVNNDLIDAIKRLFKEDDILMITVKSEQESEIATTHDAIHQFLEIEKRYPPRQVSKDLDINKVIDEINQ